MSDLFSILVGPIAIGFAGIILTLNLRLKKKSGLRTRFVIVIVAVAIISYLLTALLQMFERGSSNYYISIITFLLAASILTLIIMKSLFNHIIIPLEEATEYTERIARGDFSSDLKRSSSTDEIGNFYNRFLDMAEFLKDILMNSKDNIGSISDSAEELSSSSEEMSASSENIASSQQQISRGAADQVIQINNAQVKIQSLNEGITVINTKVSQISEISVLITNLAEQTNMLALNAAIEAARAGEAGRGFNVVAGQVRRLADDSKLAANRSETMLKEIIAITTAQKENAIDVLNSIDTIATVAEETSASTEESAAAAEEQASSMETVNQIALGLLTVAESISSTLENIDVEN